MELVILLGSKLQLYSFVLSVKQTDENLSSSSIDAGTEILARAYQTAIRLLQTAESQGLEICYWTSLSWSYIFYSVIFLLKLIGYRSCHFVDEVITRNIITQTWELVKSCSQEDGDHMSRVCAVIHYLSTEERDQVDGKPSLEVHSRMSANIHTDATWRAKKRFSQFIRAQHPEDYTVAELEVFGNGESIGMFSPPYLEGMVPNVDYLFAGFT
jgi:hypothetical protein